MIKYLGSKRRLVPVLTQICAATGPRTALDLFTGTTRVAQAFKGQGVHVTAVDSARYAHVFAQTYIATDAAATDQAALNAAIGHLNDLPGKAGYVHDTFSLEARYFQPFNGARIDAVRDAIDREYAGSPLYPMLLTSLIEAADRVDSTTGVQMAYVKQWAPRSSRPLCLRVPEMLAGPGRAVLGDAVELTGGGAAGAGGTGSGLGSFDLAYLDPPYNQHRYFTNYHVWETLVAWDAPEPYGVARKRIDSRDPSTRSAFNSKKTMPAALRSVVSGVDCELLLLSYNDESWLRVDELEELCRGRGEVATLAFDSARYVGARIGIHSPAGVKVGNVGRLSNQELLVIAGPPELVRRAVASVEGVAKASSVGGVVADRLQ
ncbi:MAG TPA: DNA adenine methylase [Acidimicrobiales bacterium]|jgi:adenine-specific DNA-methyltransferase